MPGSKVTPFEHTLIGAIAGVTEVCITQPTNGIKNALQEGRPVPRNPLALYRGLGVSPLGWACPSSAQAATAAPGRQVHHGAAGRPPSPRPARPCPLQINAGAMLPITATQFGVNRLLEQTLRRATGGGELSSGSSLVVAMGAGASSALLSGPAELVMIQQQKSGRSLAVEARTILQGHGLLKLYKGLVSTGLPAGWAFGPCGAPPAGFGRRRQPTGCSPWPGVLGVARQATAVAPSNPPGCRAPRWCGSRSTLPATWACAPCCKPTSSATASSRTRPARRWLHRARRLGCWQRLSRSRPTPSRRACRCSAAAARVAGGS